MSDGEDFTNLMRKSEEMERRFRHQMILAESGNHGHYVYNHNQLREYDKRMHSPKMTMMMDQ